MKGKDIASFLPKTIGIYRLSSLFFPLAVIFLLVGLPFAVILDMRELNRKNLHRYAHEFSIFINAVRNFYTTDILSRINENGGEAVFTHQYLKTPGGVPIPATFSIKLAELIEYNQGTLQYEFLSDLPFTDRIRPPLSDQKKAVLISFRNQESEEFISFSSDYLDSSVTVITPVAMKQPCVLCHNNHPNSPKRDWQVGDIRGIQVFSITQPVDFDLLSARYLLLYCLALSLIGAIFTFVQLRQSRIITQSNAKLSRLNNFLERLTTKLSVYLSPQIYKMIFSSKADSEITTRRKPLTVFFSDIRNFTDVVEKMEPEKITRILNEYLTEMSDIALSYGVTVDKYVGDAIVAFAGDPESRGLCEDAKACVRMAVAMQKRLQELNQKWRKEGIINSFTVRMGINSGECHVGNFGSRQRMDYTIFGKQANLASRLEGLALEGGIVISEASYALVKDIVIAKRGAPRNVKGIGEKITPYFVTGLRN